jgi:hypothetical protein
MRFEDQLGTIDQGTNITKVRDPTVGWREERDFAEIDLFVLELVGGEGKGVAVVEAVN